LEVFFLAKDGRGSSKDIMKSDNFKVNPRSSLKVKQKAKGHDKAKSHDKHFNERISYDSPDLLFATHGGARAATQSSHWFKVLPITVFSTLVILLVRMVTYKGTANEFYWFSSPADISDFFCIFKTQVISVLAVLMLVILLYNVFIQDFYIKKTFAYIPMLIYSAFVGLSYVFSDYKQYAWTGWNDRFEGTLMLLVYMFVLFYVINIVNSEKNVKWIIYPLTGSSFILGAIGVSQYYGMDFFTTNIGKKLITPSWFWDQLDALVFNFKQGQIYQTVFNPNYVSFYITLLIPIFVMMFIQSKTVVQKVIFGMAFGLAFFNMIGSVSSGGLVGLFVSFILAIVLFNKKLVEWKKPLIIVVIIALVVVGLTFGRLLPSLGIQTAASTPAAVTTSEPAVTEAAAAPLYIDFMETKPDRIRLSLDGKVFNILPTLEGQSISINVIDDAGVAISNDDPILKRVIMNGGMNQDFPAIAMQINDLNWIFIINDEGIAYVSDMNKITQMVNPPSIGFANDQFFGSSRGYIWSKTFPLLKDSFFIGHGADTFAIIFPQNDFVGKLNSFTNRNIVVDKAHNMYLGAAVGTGILSVFALLAMYILYCMQSFKIYRKSSYSSFLEYAGVGIFIGVVGFLFAGLINDSSVSTMPLFYGLFGTGIAINMLLKKAAAKAE
jgi:hypothetical protein